MYENLRKYRKILGYTQKEMAILLGYKSKNAYSMKERGERKFTIEEAKIISETFNKTVEDIFFNNKVTNVLTNCKINKLAN